MHVLDASRVVDVVSSLMSDDRRAAFEQGNRELQDKLRQQHSARRERPLMPYEAALANRFTVDWAREPLPEPAFVGRRVLADVPLADLVPYIDWTFFFAAWELKGRFPAILDHPQYGKAARDLYDNAQVLLDRIVREKLMTASGVYGFWPAASEGDDIVVYSDREHTGELVRFNLLRQQEAIADGKPNLSLADFVAPRGTRGRTDYLGAFAVTTGLGTDDLVRRFERDHDDYNAILAKALADRLAEAFAAYLHHVSRREWGIEEAGRRRRDPPGNASRHPSGVRLSRVPRPQREVQAVPAARRGRRRDGAHRKRGDDAGRERQRPVFRAPAGALLHRRPARRGSDRELRPPQGAVDRSGRTLVDAEPFVRTGPLLTRPRPGRTRALIARPAEVSQVAIRRILRQSRYRHRT